MHPCQAAYRDALEAALPGVMINQFCIDMAEGDEIGIWLRLRAPEPVLVGLGLVSPEVLDSVGIGSAAAIRGDVKITRRKRWTTLYALLFYPLERGVKRDTSLSDRIESIVLAALQKAWRPVQSQPMNPT